jgi:hypothetical protein
MMINCDSQSGGILAAAHAHRNGSVGRKEVANVVCERDRTIGTGPIVVDVQSQSGLSRRGGEHQPASAA